MTTALSRIDGDIDTMTLGEVLSKSGYFADARQAAQAVVKVLAGRELGIGPVASMTGIYIVQGRITLSANLIAAVIKRSGRYSYRVTWQPDACSIEFFEGRDSIGVSRFGTDDATKAKLGGDNWNKYPRNMWFARAMSNGAKWYCPDIFAGPIYTPDELGAEIDGETGEPIDVSPSQRRIEVGQLADPAVEHAETVFWDRYGQVLGYTQWSAVQEVIGTRRQKPATVDGWNRAAVAVDAALAAEFEQAA